MSMKTHSTLFSTSLILAAGLGLALSASAAPLVPVVPPSFSVPEIGYYGCWVYPNGGWTLITGNPGDENANPCLTSTGATLKRTGMYSATGVNIAEAWCEPNFYWIYEGVGTGPLGAAFGQAANTPNGGFCYFNLTVGDSLRTDNRYPRPPLPPPSDTYPPPDASVPFTFNVNTFVNNFRNAINTGSPRPVGYQIAVRDPQGVLVHSSATGSVTGSSGLPATDMTNLRRFDVASMSKTITATAMVAALEDLAEHVPALRISLDSSIVPFLPTNWNRTKISQVTFRSLLRHTSGLTGFYSGADTYEDLKLAVEAGPVAAHVGKFHYRNVNYSLMRLLIPYVVDGPAAYRPFEGNATKNAQITALSYRNYVRGRVFGPLGLGGVDVFHTGPLPETIYFNASRQAIPNNLNIPGYDPAIDGSGYDMTANGHVLTAGSGNWTLSAEEYSLFITRLWQGRIISAASLDSMMPRDDQSSIDVDPETATGLGIFGSRMTVGGVGWWNYNENGGGGLGGPQGIWMTLFNGFTVVYLCNTPVNFGKDMYQVIEESALPAFQVSLKILSAVHNAASGVTSMTWASQPGATYTIQQSTNLRNWSTLKTNHPSGGGLTTYIDNTGAGTVRRFYQVLYEAVN
jgi:CubicO group peptidase (beta-lactamase class C family)